jgi:hypothetical protein
MMVPVLQSGGVERHSSAAASYDCFLMEAGRRVKENFLNQNETNNLSSQTVAVGDMW